MVERIAVVLAAAASAWWRGRSGCWPGSRTAVWTCAGRGDAWARRRERSWPPGWRSGSTRVMTPTESWRAATTGAGGAGRAGFRDAAPAARDPGRSGRSRRRGASPPRRPVCAVGADDPGGRPRRGGHQSTARGGLARRAAAGGARRPDRRAGATSIARRASRSAAAWSAARARPRAAAARHGRPAPADGSRWSPRARTPMPPAAGSNVSWSSHLPGPTRSRARSTPRSRPVWPAKRAALGQAGVTVHGRASRRRGEGGDGRAAVRDRRRRRRGAPRARNRVGRGGSDQAFTRGVGGGRGA